MRVKDVMSWNVVTVSSDTPIMEAKKIMETHHIRRLPVVDKGKLMGIVNKESIDKIGPSAATSLSVWEITYLLAKIKVKEVMKSDVVTVTPDMTAEAAVSLAQRKRVGSLIAVDGDKVVGILTTNDFFYRILNPMLGIGKPGLRLAITKCISAKCIKEVMECIARHDVKIIAIHNSSPVEDIEPDLFLQLDTDNADQIMKELKAKGFEVRLRDR
jgi:acetoin utilization protein AcuB